MDEIVLDIDASDAYEFLEFAGYRAKNVGVPMRRAARALLTHIDETFESEGGWIGEYWPELNASYSRWKERNAPSAIGKTKLLHFSYPSTESLRKRATSQSAITIEEFGTDGAEMHYTLEEPFYGAIHQEGATWYGPDGRVRRIPPRQWLKIDQQLVEEWQEIFEDWLISARDRTARGDFSSVPVPQLSGAIGLFE